jgi:RNA polymerase sigma factor (sigma-70 family)
MTTHVNSQPFTSETGALVPISRLLDQTSVTPVHIRQKHGLLPDSEVTELVVEVQAVLNGLSKSRMGHHAAEEIFQDTFIELLRRRSLGWSIGQIRAQVHRITRDVRRNWFRKRKRRRVQNLFSDNIEKVMEKQDKGLTRVDFEDAINVLPNMLRVVVVAVWVNNSPMQKAAKEIGIHRNHVPKLLKQAARLLPPALGREKS